MAGLDLQRMRIHPKAKHKTFKKMKNEINLEVIDQFYSAQLSANESKDRMDALRAEVELAVKELMRQQGKPKNWTGTLAYHGFKIVVSRPKSFTWEQNTNPNVTSDPNHAIYVQQLELQQRINEQLKDMRADVKRTAEKLEQAHPDSDSIKHGFRLAFVSE